MAAVMMSVLLLAAVGKTIAADTSAYKALVMMNETNETEFTLVVPPTPKQTTPAPTFPTTAFTIKATISNADDAPKLSLLENAVKAGCGGCTVTATRVFTVSTVLSFSNVPCESFDEAKAIAAVAAAYGVLAENVKCTVTCGALRLRRLAGGMGDVSVDAEITTGDSSKANEVKAALASNTSGTALQSAFLAATGLTALPTPSVEAPKLMFAVTYAIESDDDTAVEVPSAETISTQLSVLPGLPTFNFVVTTPAPTHSPSPAPTPLADGATHAPTSAPSAQTEAPTAASTLAPTTAATSPTAAPAPPVPATTTTLAAAPPIGAESGAPSCLRLSITAVVCAIALALVQ